MAELARRPYLQALGVWTPEGALGRLEGVARLAPHLSAFAFGQVGSGGPMAGVGARWTF